MMISRFPGTCRTCNGRFAAGDEIEWSKASGSRHAACLEIVIPTEPVDGLPKHDWQPGIERATYRCKTCGATKRTSFSRFKKRGVVEAGCRGLDPLPLPVKIGPRRVALTPEVLIEMLTLLLAWRSSDPSTLTSAPSWTSVDHLRRILERLEMITTKQGNAICNDLRMRNLYRRRVTFVFSGAPAGSEEWNTKKPLLSLVPQEDGLDVDSVKMLCNYRVMITRVGLESVRKFLDKYEDTAFTRDAVEAIEEVFAAERREYEAKRAMGPIITNYNQRVEKTARRGDTR